MLFDHLNNLEQLRIKNQVEFIFMFLLKSAAMWSSARDCLFHDACLTLVDQWFRVLAWSWTLNKSWSLSGVEQTLFLDQALIRLLIISNSCLKFECSAVLDLKNLAKSGNFSGNDDWHLVFLDFC